MSNQDKKQGFTVYWRSGKRTEVYGDTIEAAFNRAGYGLGAIKAVDFYDNLPNDNYIWNENTKSWDRKTPIIDTSENVI